VTGIPGPESEAPDTLEDAAQTESDIPVASPETESDIPVASVAEATTDVLEIPQALAEESPPEEEADDEADVREATEISRTHLRGLLEALVFASDKPLKTGELARLASARIKQVRELMPELKQDYAQRGIVLDEVAGGWVFRTSAKYAPFVRDLAGEKPVRLTRAQIETLAIAAYRQPLTRPEIDEIRGVDSGATLKLLLERDLLRILGKKDEPGRPLLYGTTSHFLEFFGLKSLKDLPTLKEFTELSDESRLVAEAELGEVLPEAASRAPVEDEPGPHDTVAPPADMHDTVPPLAPDAES
jgi:segregation and condensation protein B